MLIAPLLSRPAWAVEMDGLEKIYQRRITMEKNIWAKDWDQGYQTLGQLRTA